MSSRSVVCLVLVLLMSAAARAQEESWQDLLDQAVTLTDQSEHESALAFAQRALRLAEDVLGPADPAVAQILGRLSACYYHTGDFEASEAAGLRALRILEAASVPDENNISAMLLHVGNMRLEAADYARAQAYYDRALAMRERRFGPDHPLVANALVQRALLHRRVGDFTKAERDFRRALSIHSKCATFENPVRDSFKLAAILRGLANLYRVRRMSEAAEPLLKQSLAIQRRIGSSKWEYGSTLTDLMSMYHALGRFNEADSVGRRALEVIMDALGPEHPWVANALRQCAQVHLALGRTADARNEFEKALAIHQAALGAGHPEVATTLELLSDLMRREHDLAQALTLSERAWRIRWSTFVDNAMALSEQDALRFAHRLRGSVDRLLSVAVDYGLDSLSNPDAVVHVVLSSKGQVSDEIFRRQRSTQAEADPTSAALTADLQEAKAQLSRHYIRTRAVGGPSPDSIRSLLHTIDTLERELLAQSAHYRARRERQSLTPGLISYMLPAGSILLEYVKFDYRTGEPGPAQPSYLALTLAKDGQVHLKYLGKAELIESQVNRYRAHMVRVTSRPGVPNADDEAEFRDIAHALYYAIWRPVSEFIPAGAEVFVAPDAGLNLIPFATLLDTANAYLIERTPLQYLSAGRDLVRDYGQQTQTSGLLAMGDPDYDSPPAQLEGAANRRHTIRASSIFDTALRQVPTCDQFRAMRVSALPMSRIEVERIVESWQESSGEAVSAFYRTNASEDRFKVEAPGRRVIHLATHGYYLTAECLAVDSSGDDQWYMADHPLLLSGLLLAGVNRRHAEETRHAGNDGVLTAYEISALNLKGTELVVLSGCETGLGSVKEGEGVYGLRRAFQMAGAQTVVSSLWPVSDRHTALFMSKLYEKRESTLPERLRALQLASLADLRARGMSDHPVNWGAFIASGSWR